MISIILIEPKTGGNVGAIARAMKNFNLTDLVLINPKCKISSLETKKRAKHAQDIIQKAKIKNISYLKKFHTLIGTTAKLGTDYNIQRSPITPEQLAEKINVNQKIGIIFGRESSGLTNEEISLCDFVVSIQSSKIYPVMNLSHAATIIFYELFKRLSKSKTGDQIKVADKADKNHLIKTIDKLLNKMKFKTPSKKQTQRLIWKRIIGKSFLTKREMFALMGFFKKLL